MIASLAAAAIVAAPSAERFESPWASVSCNDAKLAPAGLLGAYYPATKTITLRGFICDRLGQLQRGLPASWARYEALHILAHELAHSSGYGHGGPVTADCHAYRTEMAVAKRIWIPAATRRALQRRFRVHFARVYCLP